MKGLGTRILGISSLILAWAVVTSLRLINPLFLPSPADVVRAGYRMFVGEGMFLDLGYTLARVFLGFLIGALVGLVVGALMGCSRRIYSYLEVQIDFVRSVPVVALFPLFLVIFGLGETSKVLIGAWSSSFLVLINTMYGVRSCNITRTLMARTMGATKLQVFRKITFPGALQEIIAGLRLGFPIALIVIIMSEMFMGTRNGLGQKLINAQLLYRIPEMYAAIGLSGVLGYAANFAFVRLERKFAHWVGR